MNIVKEDEANSKAGEDEANSKAGYRKFGYLQMMTQGNIGGMNAESCCERVVSCASLLNQYSRLWNIHKESQS